MSHKSETQGRERAMRFANWNLKYPGKGQSQRRVDFLERWDWDVIALQEVSIHAWNAIMKSGIAESSYYALDGFGLTSQGRSHGAALLARNGFRLFEPQLIPHLPKSERALAAVASLVDTAVTVASWHAPNAAGEGVTTKMKGYRGVVDWLNGVSGATILGFDSNHWNRSTNLESQPVPDSNDRWLLENQFFGSNEVHALRDAFLDHLIQHPLEYEESLKQRPQGPLAVSYVHGRTEDRFDYVFVSDEVFVKYCSYNYREARAAGSDHGIVTADLLLTSAP